MNISGIRIQNIDELLKSKMVILKEIIADIEKEYGQQLNISYISISNKHDAIYYDHIVSNELHEIRSISKLILALCIGNLMINKDYVGKKITLNTEIWPYIQRIVKVKIEEETLLKLKKITIKHLLTQTVGYKNNELLYTKTLIDILPKDYFNFIIKEPIIFENGCHFKYSNATAYILSVVFQECTGENVYKYAQKHIFKPMNINNHEWLNYGDYCAGATGLKMRCTDLQKFGQLLLNKGKWNKQKLIMTKFVNEMIVPQVDISRESFANTPLAPIAYGYFLWIDINGNYFASGANGQYLFIVPKRNIALTILAKQPNTIPLQKVIKRFISIC